MDTLYEIKTRIITFIEKNEVYVKPAAKFILLLMAYLMVHLNLGYYAKLNNIFIPLILSVGSAIVPMGIGAVILGLYTAANLYGLGIEIAGIFLLLMLLAYLLYFRFAREKAYLTVLTPVLSMLGIPYAMPIATGLTSAPAASMSVIVGMIMFYFLKGIKANEELLLASEDALKTTKLHIALEQILTNKEMWLIVAAFFFTNVIVYFIRRLAIKEAWKIAIGVGGVVQLLLILIGKLIIGNPYGILGLILGSIVSVLICFVFQFMVFDLDYQRIERVQFEDDNYYYYVRAVPKVLVVAKEKQVKTFNETKVKKEEEVEREIARELDIDPENLK
ncbi:MAG: hypothetical protein J5749_05755 [Lachnospiraceae bacterium]|nr:hypothetical protein [Lachnospiraceae bacterium]MBR4795322.1 hypothetical protein [Lachnospiraceae bacterium]